MEKSNNNALDNIQAEIAKYVQDLMDNPCPFCGGKGKVKAFQSMAFYDSPSPDVAPVRHGRWVKSEDDYYGLYMIKCSMCREEWYFECDDDAFDLNYHYCPNCGAKMDGGTN